MTDLPERVEPSPDVIASLVAVSPNITPLLIAVQQKVIRQVEAALQDERMNEPALAWLRTMLRTLHQNDDETGVVDQFLRGEIPSTIGSLGVTDD